MRKRRSVVSRLRRSYFAHAGDAAARYGITFDRLVLHLWHARRTNRHFLLRSVCQLDDLVHAVACVDEVSLAWFDLAERYERALIRRCHRSTDVDAMILVRRLVAELHRRNGEPLVAQAPSLRCYTGDKPLKNWLAERLSAVRVQVAMETGRLKSPALSSVQRRVL